MVAQLQCRLLKPSLNNPVRVEAGAAQVQGGLEPSKGAIEGYLGGGDAESGLACK